MMHTASVFDRPAGEAAVSQRTLEIRGVSCSFGAHRVLDDISADISGGEMTAVIGGNGVGKTTMLKAIAGFARASGAVSLREDGELARLRPRDIAYVPQLGTAQTRLTVFEMVLLGLVNDLSWHVTDEQLQRVCDILRHLNIERLAERRFATLSGGQRQLVSMAQSLISRPKVLLLDEPTSALDLRHQLIVMEVAAEYTRVRGAVTMFVVHDLSLASRCGARLLALHDARIRAYGLPSEVLTRDLVAELYGVDADIRTGARGITTVTPISPLGR